MTAEQSKELLLSVQGLKKNFGEREILKGIDFDVHKGDVVCVIGPSGSGKSTLIRCVNYLEQPTDGVISYRGENVLECFKNLPLYRTKVGMVFQQPNVFVKSIYENISYAPKLHGMIKNKDEEEALVVDCLQKVGLFEEVKDKLKQNALALSGGQQQRLCIARALAIKPKLLLLDEPTSALDPISSGVIEELLKELSHNLSMIMVTHNMQQGKRVADYTAFFHLGELIELGESKEFFENPKQEKTKAYLSGAFG